MPFIAAFTAAEMAAAAEAAVAAEAAASVATAAEAAAAAEAATAAGTAAATTAAEAGIMGAELAGAQALAAPTAGSAGAGIVSQATPALEAATAVGGQGAGTAATQAAMDSAMQSAAGAPGNLLSPAGITSVPEPATTLAPAGDMTAAQEAYLNASTASLNRGITPGVNPLPAYPSASLSPETLAATGNAPAQPSIYSLSNPVSAPEYVSTQYQLGRPVGGPSGAGMEGAGRGLSASQPGLKLPSLQTPTPQPGLFDKAMAYAKENPFTTGAMLYSGAYKLGLLEPSKPQMPEKKKYGEQYTISKDFQASEATPNVYQPSYKPYAEGGVMSVGGPSSQVMEPRATLNPMDTVATMADGGMPAYAKGGKTMSDSLEFYKELTANPKAPTGKGATAPRMEDDVGIYYDLDPDTRYQDPLTAAQIRQAKLNKRANIQTPSGGVMKRPTPMGQINLSAPGSKAQDGGGTTEAARGGIMQAGSSLGGYAAGGNPRLLKGPGDGMSDNIPAMIGRKQPARLADGEFVIPADVVSHLGNGSTEAGAKRLHEMMTRVRKERTGNPKQGKQINPSKFMPK